MVGQFTFSEVVHCAVDAALELVGIWLLWRLVLSPAARAKETPRQLAEWSVGWLGLIALVLGAILTEVAITIVAKVLGPTSPDDDTVLVVNVITQMAVVAWCMWFSQLAIAGKGFAPMFRPRAALAGGVATFLIAMTTINAVFLVWTFALQSAGVQPEIQDMAKFVAAFYSPAEQVLCFLLVVVGGPVAEELVFRGGLYHFARGRLPRWAALLLPACIFAALHFSLTAYVPIMAIGVILSLAYDRTGNLAVPMVAHGLINLHSLATQWFFG